METIEVVGELGAQLAYDSLVLGAAGDPAQTMAGFLRRFGSRSTRH
jgi:hypothetical protein